MAAMNGGLPYEFLNYKSVPQNNNAGTNGPTPPSFQANNNFTRYPPNIEIINLDDDVPEIENLNNGFPPFSVPAQTSAIQTQQTYSYHNGLSLSNNQNATHTGALTELLTGHPNYRIAPPQTFSYQGENRYNNYVNPPHTGQMECRTSLGFSSSDFFMPAQQGCSSSSSRPVQLNMGYSNERINGSILDIPNNMVNDNSHHIHTGTNGTAQTQPGLFPVGTPPQIGFSEQQQEQQVVPTEEVGTNQITLDSQGIDLNTTPQPKQRRRKYVPKVFKEGQKTRTPKTATPKPTTPKPAIEDRPKRKYVRKKGIEMPPIETPPPSGGTSDKLLDEPNSHTPNVADESIRTPSSCIPNGKNGFDNGISGVKTPVQVSVGTSKTRKPVRRSLNFDGEELISNGYNNGNGNTNVASQSDLNTVPAQSPGTTTGRPGSTVPASRISLDLNISSNRIQEEFDRAFPPASSTQNGLAANTKQVNNGSGMNFSGYPYPPMPQMQQPNNHLMNNNNNYFHPSERNIVPSGLLALAKRNEQLIRESLCKYGLDIGNKRDHNALLQLGGNSNWSQIIQTPKKMRITDGTNIIMNNNNNNNNFYQNGTTRPNSSSSNSTQLHNAVGPTGGVLPNSSSSNSTQLHNAAGPTGGVFSLADAQRMVELQKKQISRSQAQQFLNGTPNASRSSTNCQVSTPDRQPHWFMSEPNPLKPAPPVVNNVNNLTTSQMNQTQPVVTYSEKTSLVNQIQSVVNYSEKTSLVNQYSNNALIIANSPQPNPPAKSPVQSPAPKPEAKKRGRPKAVKEVLVLDPLSTPPAKEKQRKPRGRKPSTSPIAMSSSTMSSSTMSAVDFQYILDLIVQKMKLLDINRIETAPVQGHAQQCYAMVPYGGVTGTGTGTMVVYDVDKKKKKQSRARVVLSPITNQVWNLLMGEAYEPLDESNEKTLEEERVVLRGRIASFISRMHLVQGDRRFSPWKGSVVDSVVGVFLTQNVSDHLSSSAFMGLVSKYGPKAQSVNPQHVNENSLSIRSFLNLQTPNIPKEIVIIEEDFTDLSSLLNSEEKDENNSSQGSNKENNNNIIINNNGKKLGESSPDSGPELVMNNSSEEQNSTVSSQNSVVSSQSSPENHIGSSFFYDMDPFSPMNTSYTQLLQLAESNRAVELFPDLNKVDTEIGASCFYSNNLESYSQIENNYSACPSGGINDYSQPQNGNNHYSTSSFVPDMFNASNTEISIPQWPRVNKTSPPQPITPMVKIRENIENAPTPQNISNPSKTSSEAVHNASKDRSPKSALETVQNPSKTASETVQNPSKTASETVQKTMDGTVISEGDSSNNNNINNNNNNNNNNKNNKTPKKGKGVGSKGKKPDFDWDSLRRGVRPEGVKKERDYNFMDSLDYDALRRTSVRELSDAIRERGMNNMLAERIKDFLDRLVRDHGATDLEWLRDVEPDKAKDYLLSIRGLGLKSVECVRLLTLHHLAFPVDTNVGRICVRLGWVPLQPLPESLQLHLLEMYPILENIQKYLWPRLCNLDQRTLYELHYQMITFGKVFCTKSKPNCNACPMRAECKHFASAFASARLALPGPDDKSLLPSSSNPSSSTNNMTPPVNPSTSQAPPPQLGLPSSSTNNMTPPFNPSTSQAPPRQIGLPSSSTTNWTPPFNPSTSQAPPTQTGFPSSSTTNWAPPIPNLPRLSLPSPSQNQIQNQTQKPITNEPIIEEPDSPEPDKEKAIEDAFLEEDPEEIPTIKLDLEEFTENLKNYIKKNNLEIQEAEMSKALVAISPDQAFLPTPKLKNISRLRTEHQVYELPDNHALLAGYEPRERDDPCPYLLSIWTPGETAMSTEPPKSLCICQDVSELCDKEACRRCVGIKEARREVVRGTILIPCRTAMRGSFPLNGTYFQVNELFADHGSSRQPVDIPREWIWNLPRRTVYFGTSVTTIFKGLSTEDIQHCFWRGFVCVRGFDRVTRAPRPLYARLHFPASNKQNKNGSKTTKVED